jgi:hypothetical protein
MEGTMNGRSGLQWRLVMALAALTLLGAGCGLMAPRTERYVAPPVGTNWTTARRDTGSYGSSAVLLPGSYLGVREWRGRKVHRFDSPELAALLSAEDASGFVAMVKGDNPVISWEPPVSYQYPLEVGKTWKRKFKFTNHATKQTVDVEDTQTVEAYEDVTMPAGTFKAWRVRTVDNFGNDNVQWYSPDAGIFVKQSLRRTAKHAAGAGTREMELVNFSRGK